MIALRTCHSLVHPGARPGYSYVGEKPSVVFYPFRLRGFQTAQFHHRRIVPGSLCGSQRYHARNGDYEKYERELFHRIAFPDVAAGSSLPTPHGLGDPKLGAPGCWIGRNLVVSRFYRPLGQDDETTFRLS